MTTTTNQDRGRQELVDRYKASIEGQIIRLKKQLREAEKLAIDYEKSLKTSWKNAGDLGRIDESLFNAVETLSWLDAEPNR